MGVLLMLVTIGGLIAAGILLIIAVIGHKMWLAKFTLGAVAIWFGMYTAMLLGFSLTSTEKMLAANEPKSFCGFYLDCHMHTAIASVRTASQIDDLTAVGTYYIVRVKVFSDAKNPDIALRLTDPDAVLIDKGRSYSRHLEAESRLPTGNVRLDQEVKAPDIVEKEIVFDITGPTDELKLMISEGGHVDKGFEAFLIDDEDSIFHKRVYFKLKEQIETTGVK